MNQLALFSDTRCISISTSDDEMPMYQGVPLDGMDWLDSDGTTTICMTALGVCETWDGPLIDHLRAIYALGGWLGVRGSDGKALVRGLRQEAAP